MAVEVADTAAVLVQVSMGSVEWSADEQVRFVVELTCSDNQMPARGLHEQEEEEESAGTSGEAGQSRHAVY